MLGELIGAIGLGDKESRKKDLLGRFYEYFPFYSPFKPYRNYWFCFSQ